MIGRILSPVINVFLQHHVDCVSYYSGVCRTEGLVHSTTVVLHVVKIHMNIYYYILFCYSSCENPQQKPFCDTNTASMISYERDDDNWEDRDVGRFGRLRRPESLVG
jgi:hypothetical protein